MTNNLSELLEDANLNQRDVASNAATVLSAAGKFTDGTAGDANSLTGNAGNIANTLAGTVTGSAVTIAKNGGSNVEDSTKALGKRRTVDPHKATKLVKLVGALTNGLLNPKDGAPREKRQIDLDLGCGGTWIRTGASGESDIVVTAAHCV